MVQGLKFPAEYIQEATELFRLLSDKTRLSLLLLLAEGEHNVGQLCAKLQLPQPTVSHHLALMRMSGLLSKRRYGKQMIYRVNTQALHDLGAKFIRYASDDGKKVRGDKFTFSLTA